MKRLMPVIVAGAALFGGCYIVATEDGLAVAVVPRYSYIPGTTIRHVTNTSGTVLYYNSAYWRYANGAWWRSSIWNDGWVRVLPTSVPTAFLRIPATHAAHRVVKTHPRFRANPSIVKAGLGGLTRSAAAGAKPVKTAPSRSRPNIAFRRTSRTPGRSGAAPGKSGSAPGRSGSSSSKPKKGK